MNARSKFAAEVLMTSTASRRGFLSEAGMGFAGLALGAMLHRDEVVRAGEPASAHATAGAAHFAPKAKSVIWIFLVGGMSQMESFDPKPALNKYAGMSIDETPFKSTLESPYLKKNLREFVAGLHHSHPKLYPMQVGHHRRDKVGSISATGGRTSAGWRTTWRSYAPCGPRITITEPSCSFIPVVTRWRDSFRRSGPGCTMDLDRSTTTCRASV